MLLPDGRLMQTQTQTQTQTVYSTRPDLCVFLPGCHRRQSTNKHEQEHKHKHKHERGAGSQQQSRELDVSTWYISISDLLGPADDNSNSSRQSAAAPGPSNQDPAPKPGLPGGSLPSTRQPKPGPGMILLRSIKIAESRSAHQLPRPSIVPPVPKR